MHELAVAAVNRVISALSRSQPALRDFIRVLSWTHLATYRLTRGRLTTRLGLPGAEMILLTSTGRKTGKPRTVPLLSVRHGDDWLVIASNAGLDRSPGWWFNLRANPAATVRPALGAGRGEGRRRRGQVRAPAGSPGPGRRHGPRGCQRAGGAVVPASDPFSPGRGVFLVKGRSRLGGKK